MGYKKIVALAILFFVVTAGSALALARFPQNSPDEASTLFFITTYARTGALRVTEPMNAAVGDLLHPRAVAIVDHDIAPGGFLGLPVLYGAIARAIGVWVIPIITPLLSALALLCFFDVCRRVFSGRIAWWATVIVMVHPAWIVYTIRGLFPNVALCAFVIMGAWMFVCASSMRSRGWWHACLWIAGGAAMGTALALRPTAAGWVGASMLFWALAVHVPWKRAVYALCGAAFPLALLLFFQARVYGSLFATGYASSASDTLVPQAFTHTSSLLLSFLSALFAPFGMHIAALVTHGYLYLLFFFRWMSLPLARGVFEWMRERQETARIRRLYAFWYSGMSCMLLVYYGSWSLSDSTIAGPTLGTSFVRYWLPIYVFGAPFVGWVGVRWYDAIRRKRVFLAYCAVLFFLVWSGTFAYAVTDESILSIARTVRTEAKVRSSVLAATESRAVVLTDQTDKTLFPARRVIVFDPMDEAAILRALPILVAEVPVYYLTQHPETAVIFLNRYRLASTAYTFKKQQTIADYTLYAFQ